jgi:hypothetical protein
MKLMPKLTLTSKVSIVTGVFFLLFALILVILTRIILVDNFQTQTKTLIASFIEKQVQTHLNPDVFVHRDRVGDEMIKENTIFDKFFNEIRTEDVLGMGVWDDQFTIIYYYDPATEETSNENINKKYPDDNNYAKSMRGETTIVIGKPQDPKSQKLADKYDEIMHVYVPVYFTGNESPVGVVEVYYKLDTLNLLVRNVQTKILITTFVVFLVLYLLLMFLTMSASSTLEHQKQSLEDLSSALENKVKIRTQELEYTKESLQQKVAQLERFQELTVGREIRMAQLKKEIDILKSKKDSTV